MSLGNCIIRKLGRISFNWKEGPRPTINAFNKHPTLLVTIKQLLTLLLIIKSWE